MNNWPATMTKKPPYVNVFRDTRTGRLRARFYRRGHKRAELPLPIGSDAFNAAYAAALNATTPPPGSDRVKAGTLDALIVEYYQSLDFKRLRPVTQSTYRRRLEWMRQMHGHRSVAGFTVERIEKILGDMADTPKQANKLHRYLRMVLNFAVKRKWRTDNPVTFVKTYRVDGGFQTWPEALIAQYEKHWPQGTPQRLLFDLVLHTGIRRGDAAKAHRNHIESDEIRVVQNKTGRPIWITIHKNLARSLAKTPMKGMYLIGTQAGDMRSDKALGGYFRRACNDAGIPVGYSLHGLRKSCGTRLADAGCTAHQIMAILGHVSLREAERYTVEADQRKLARQAVEKLK